MKKGYNPERSRRGFTLIELLVVISIIAVLSTIGFSTFQGVQSKARDATRKQDLTRLAFALEIYLQKNGTYPTTDSDGCLPIDDTLYEQIAPSSGKAPLDPTGNPYCYVAVDNGQSYRLFAKLENCSDPNIIQQPNCIDANYNYSMVSPDITTITSAPGDTIALQTPLKPFSCENYGDVDNNRQIDSNDADMVTQYDAGLLTFTDDQKILANVDQTNPQDDRAVDSADAQHILRYVNGDITQLNVCTLAKPPPCGQFGDASGDGRVTWMDADEALNIAMSKNSLYTGQSFTDAQKTNANVSDPSTSAVTSSDALQILRYVNGTQTSFETCPKSPPCGQYGDVDLDGEVSYNDKVMISNYVAYTVQLTDVQKENADVNNDGTVTGSDALLVRNYLTGSGTAATTFPAVCTQ